MDMSFPFIKYTIYFLEVESVTKASPGVRGKHVERVLPGLGSESVVGVVDGELGVEPRGQPLEPDKRCLAKPQLPHLQHTLHICRRYLQTPTLCHIHCATK